MIAIAVCAMAAGFAAPAQAQLGQRGPAHPSQDSYAPTPHQTPDDGESPSPASLDAGAIAEGLRVAGRCDKAVPMLQPIAERGAGHEIAQLDLGLCLFDLAKADKDAKHAGDLRAEAADWVLRAANGGFAKAQAMAVVLYLDGNGVAADPVEAEKWAILYHGNGMRIGIGLRDTPPDIRKRLDAVVSDAQESEAKKRARDWTPPTQSAEEE
jgi:TPR repeat protein